MTPAPDPHDRIAAILAFLDEANRLKDTMRSGHTPQGRQESTAEHSWRLCLLAILLGDTLEEVDLLRLIKICIVHDLGEAVSGDVPATQQRSGDDRAAREAAIRPVSTTVSTCITASRQLPGTRCSPPSGPRSTPAPAGLPRTGTDGQTPLARPD